MTVPIGKKFLESLGYQVVDIPPSEEAGKQEADYLVSWQGVRVLVEEKHKGDSDELIKERKATLSAGKVHVSQESTGPVKKIERIVEASAKQLLSSSDKEHDFRVSLLLASGINAEAKVDQFKSALYGSTDIFEMGKAPLRKCYFFRSAEFSRRMEILDGAIVVKYKSGVCTATLCLNPRSLRYQNLKSSKFITPFGEAVSDPLEYEKVGAAYIADPEIDTRDANVVLDHLRAKYGLGMINYMDMNALELTVLSSGDS